MEAITVRDVIWFVTLAITVAGFYWKLNMKLQHLDDTKAEKESVQAIVNELNATMQEVKVSLTTLTAQLDMLFNDKGKK